MTDDKILNDDINNDDNPAGEDRFYADDVQAAALADNNMNPDEFEKEEKEPPVTSGNMEIGDLDNDAELQGGSEKSYDEESVPVGDNVADN